jgi:hypothetical protein
VACQNRLVGGDGFNNVPVPLLLQLLAQEAATAVLETTVWCIRVAKDRNDAMVKDESGGVFRFWVVPTKQVMGLHLCVIQGWNVESRDS